MERNLDKTRELEKDGLPDEVTSEKIIDLLRKIKDKELLMRIYRFIQYIYIHKT